MECRDAPAERPRPAPGQALSRSLVALDQNSTIIAVIEMSQSSWLIAGVLPGIERQPRKKLEPSPERLLGLLQRWRDEAIRAGKGLQRCTRPRDPSSEKARRQSTAKPETGFVRIEKVGFAMDSPLEGGVSCELVSENGQIPLLGNIQGISSIRASAAPRRQR